LQGKTILIADDEKKISEVIRAYLEIEGFKVLCAYDGAEALRLFDAHAPDLVVLDLMLPDISGEEVCAAIRRKSRVPVIMLTAKTAEEDIVHGLGLGADDYVTKPFSNRQLLARIGAALRRAADEAVPLAGRLSFGGGDLVLNSVSHEVRKKGETVPLTPSEYNILMTLAKYPGKTFTREELITFALEEGYEGCDRVIDTHIKNIRQKIEDDPKTPVYVVTVFGVGYRFGEAV